MPRDGDLGLLPSARLPLHRPHPASLPLALRLSPAPGLFAKLQSGLSSRWLDICAGLSPGALKPTRDTRVLLTNLLFACHGLCRSEWHPAAFPAVQRRQAHLQASWPDPCCSPASPLLTGSRLRPCSSQSFDRAQLPARLRSSFHWAASILLTRGSAAPPPSGLAAPSSSCRCTARGLARAWLVAGAHKAFEREDPSLSGCRLDGFTAEGRGCGPAHWAGRSASSASLPAWARPPAICQPQLPRLLGETTSPSPRTGRAPRALAGA